MKKILCFAMLTFTLSFFCLGQGVTPTPDCNKDVKELWSWTKKYMQHQGGARDAYFAWSVNNKTFKQNSPGSASGGELYFVTDLLFASNRWGNETGINYYAEARRILDAMWSKNGAEGVTNVINTEHKQITFVPDKGGYGWTDPSYHVPAFYEIWAEFAKDGHEQFYRDCADTARVYLHHACNRSTGGILESIEIPADCC